jgi:NADPH:quinone reductase-like Zn-dependent oxidoreductase
MKAMQVDESEEEPFLLEAEVSQPLPGEGEVLVRVRAAGVTRAELHWHPTTHTKSGEARHHAIPGHEFSGVVAALGQGVDGFTVGQAVYGMNDWFAEGATAEYCTTQPPSIALKPVSLSHEEAATIPISALTAWQGLFDRAKLSAGERVLVHGGAGAVGILAVQLAHLHGAHVIATVSTDDVAFVAEIGADEVIDYKTERFDELVRNVDVVFDTVGGETLERSWGVLREGGRLVTIFSGNEGEMDQRIKDAFFIVEPKQEQLVEITKLLDSGKLKAFVKAVVPFPEAAAAYSGDFKGVGRGKVVIAIPEKAR